MKKLNKAIIVLSKIAEVFMWVGTGLCSLILVCVAAGKGEWLRFLTDASLESTEFVSNGFSLIVSDVKYARASFIIFFITALITIALMGMVFRNVNLIFRTSEGLTGFSKGQTPFQPDNIRMVREIGIFCIAIPVVEIIMSIIAVLVLGHDNVETSVNTMQIFMGLVMLALSQYFAYGMELEEETEGLV